VIKRRKIVNSLLVSWYRYILEKFILIGTKLHLDKESRLLKIDYRTPEVPYTTILHMCALKSDKWTKKVVEVTNQYTKYKASLLQGEVIKPQRHGRSGKKRKREDMSAAPQTQDEEQLDQSKSEEDVKQKPKKRQKVSDDENWQKCTDEYPGIGLLFGQIPNLELPTELDSYIGARFLVPKEETSHPDDMQVVRENEAEINEDSETGVTKDDKKLNQPVDIMRKQLYSFFVSASNKI